MTEKSEGTGRGKPAREKRKKKKEERRKKKKTKNFQGSKATSLSEQGNRVHQHHKTKTSRVPPPFLKK